MASTYCFLRTEIGVSVMELYCSECLISHTFQHKCYISIAHTGNVIMYIIKCLRKQSHISFIIFLAQLLPVMFKSVSLSALKLIHL